VVLPDNVLFEAGVGTEVRRDLMHKCNLHTILRLPTGIFYAQGVKTNVLFFTKGHPKDKLQEENCTEQVWVYDLRTNMPSFGKRTPFGEQHLAPFEDCYTGQNKRATARDGGSAENAGAIFGRVEGDWNFNAKDTTTEAAASSNQELENSRWRVFTRDWIRDTKGDSLDISWLK
ncbi:N-6 DNA methylase, partial [Phytohabitans suffuscus]